MITYRVRLDVPGELVLFISRLLARHRKEIGTRKGTRSLGCYRCRQVLPVPGNRALDRLAEVVPQVPSAGYLHRVRRAPGAAVGIAPARSRQMNSAPGRAASHTANDSDDRSSKMSTGLRVSTSTSSVP